MSNVIIDWTNTFLEFVRNEQMTPPETARGLAIMHSAVFDAVNAANGFQYEGYHTNSTSGVAVSANAQAAAISACYTVIKALFPTDSRIETTYQQSLATLNGQNLIQEGVDYGKQVAQATLTARGADGSVDKGQFTISDDPGIWSPNNGTELVTKGLPNWGNVTPFGMTSSDQFRPDAPPELTSQEYADAFNQVKSLGSKTSTTRTADQTQIAKFWADGARTVTPPGHWQQIAGDFADSHNLSLLDTARMYALMSMAEADAAIAAWDAKYTYLNWRPDVGIHRADEDGNSATTKDTAWIPLITTPPFPDYVSGHSTFSAAAGNILARIFGTMDLAFSSKSDTLPGITRNFDSIQEAIDEAAISRVYGGIHWEFSSATGKEMGVGIASYIADNYLLQQRYLTSGADNFTATSSNVVVQAMGGDDSVTGSASIDKLCGGAGADNLSGANGDDIIIGGAAMYDTTDGADNITGGQGDDRIFGNAGNDTLCGGNGVSDTADGADYINAGRGDDSVMGNAGDDTLYGSLGGDTIHGGLGNDVIYAGSSRIDTLDGNDVVYGGQGVDTIFGNAGNDTIYGGRSELDGYDSADVIYGGRGNDVIYGNGGNDSMDGNTGNDTMHGGSGSDTFLFGSATGADVIRGFDDSDVIQVITNIDGTGITTASGVFALAIVSGGDTIITFSSGNSVTLVGYTGLTADQIEIVSEESF